MAGFSIDLERARLPTEKIECHSPNSLLAASLLLNASRTPLRLPGVKKTPLFHSSRCTPPMGALSAPPRVVKGSTYASIAAAAAAAVQEAMTTVHAAHDKMKHLEPTPMGLAMSTASQSRRRSRGRVPSSQKPRNPGFRARAQAEGPSYQHVWKLPGAWVGGGAWPVEQPQGMSFQFPKAGHRPFTHHRDKRQTFLGHYRNDPVPLAPDHGMLVMMAAAAPSSPRTPPGTPLVTENSGSDSDTK